MPIETLFNQRYDANTKLMYVNDIPSVMHCHHYTTNYIKVALDFADLNGIENMVNAAEDAFFLVFKKYFISEKTQSLTDRTKVCVDLYSFMGMGTMKVLSLKEEGGEVELSHSHVDEGWLKKFGKIDRPINFITQGYLKAMASAIYNRKIRSYGVDEPASIVRGSRTSRFVIRLLA